MTNKLNKIDADVKEWQEYVQRLVETIILKDAKHIEAMAQSFVIQ